MLFLRWLKEINKIIHYIHFSSCTHSQWAWAENAGLGHHIFRPTIFFQSTFWATELSDKQCEHSFSPTTFQVWSL